jgi:hypothetical protein
MGQLSMGTLQTAWCMLPLGCFQRTSVFWSDSQSLFGFMQQPITTIVTKQLLSTNWKEALTSSKTPPLLVSHATRSLPYASIMHGAPTTHTPLSTRGFFDAEESSPFQSLQIGSG